MQQVHPSSVTVGKVPLVSSKREPVFPERNATHPNGRCLLRQKFHFIIIISRSTSKTPIKSKIHRSPYRFCNTKTTWQCQDSSQPDTSDEKGVIALLHLPLLLLSPRSFLSSDYLVRNPGSQDHTRYNTTR